MQYDCPTQCVILVGGLGTRLGTAVRDVPKPMLNIGGKPFLVHLMREIGRYGFFNFLLLAGYHSEVIREYFSEMNSVLPIDTNVTIITEQEQLGTGGALRNAFPFLDKTFLLCNGDSLCLFDLNDLTDISLDKETMACMQVARCDGNRIENNT